MRCRRSGRSRRILVERKNRITEEMRNLGKDLLEHGDYMGVREIFRFSLAEQGRDRRFDSMDFLEMKGISECMTGDVDLGIKSLEEVFVTISKRSAPTSSSTVWRAVRVIGNLAAALHAAGGPHRKICKVFAASEQMLTRLGESRFWAEKKKVIGNDVAACYENLAAFCRYEGMDGRARQFETLAADAGDPSEAWRVMRVSAIPPQTEKENDDYWNGWDLGQSM